MLHSAVFNTSEICAAYGVNNAVISPGSRNAPLIVSFSRNEKIRKWVIPDERSAGFVALGMAQRLGEPVVLCCTSGTALLNYAPAVAEAFYREIPLIILSADRPPELIDQREGQTIRQHEALHNHVRASITLPVVIDGSSATAFEEQLTGMLQQSMTMPKGPVHINIPFREPFYPSQDQKLDFKTYDPVWPATENESAPVDLELIQGEKVLILVGQHNPDEELSKALSKLVNRVPIIGSPLSNLAFESFNSGDFWISQKPELQPDLLLTTGLSVLSKPLKQFLRSSDEMRHVHFDPAGIPVDTFQSNPELVQDHMAEALEDLDLDCVDPDYLKSWREFQDLASEAQAGFIADAAFSESKAFHQVLNSLPGSALLHVGNSMPVRFAEIFGVSPGITTYSNRGTSGIDGCNSTCVGTTVVSNDLNVLLVGDLSFLYDRNAFLHSYNLANLRIIVFNNLGGGIFRLIDGPSELEELETYFEARHDRTAEYICAENSIEYMTVRNEDELTAALSTFYEVSSQPKLIEVFSDPATNEKVFKQLKQHIHEQLS